MDKRESEILEQMLSEKLEIQKEKPIFNDFCSSLYNMAAGHIPFPVQQYRLTDTHSELQSTFAINKKNIDTDRVYI